MAKTVDVPPSYAPGLPLRGMGGNLPCRRPDTIRGHGEMRHADDLEPVELDLFDKPPEYQLIGPEDENGIRRLREYNANRITQLQQYITTVRHNGSLNDLKQMNHAPP